jgi:hypothetical protein
MAEDWMLEGEWRDRGERRHADEDDRMSGARVAWKEVLSAFARFSGTLLFSFPHARLKIDVDIL